MLTKTVTYTDEQILRIFLIMQTVCLLPFLITDLALIHNSFSECLLANFGERQKNPFGIFVLGEWVYMDGYIKLAVYTCCYILQHHRSRVSMQTHTCRPMWLDPSTNSISSILGGQLQLPFCSGKKIQDYLTLLIPIVRILHTKGIYSSC